MSFLFARKAAELPTSTGVYLFKDAEGRVLYVGKAVDLRARVRQYLGGTDGRFMVPFLVSEAADIDVVLTRTEKEALLLENTLIKQHRPRFNVRLRDDSAFLRLRLDPRQEWPRFTLVRSVADDGARYFGPYPSASRARHTLAWLQRIVPLRTCTDAVLRSRRRPCLLHQMGRCLAPCVGAVDVATYAARVDEAVLLVQGRDRTLVERLLERMRAAAEVEDFEEAARLRDLAREVERALERQHVVDTRLEDRDVWGVYLEGDAGTVAVLPVREGALGEPRVAFVRGHTDAAEVLSSVLNTTYATPDDLPPELLVPVDLEDRELLEEVLTERRGGRVHLRRPRRGRKVQLLDLARENARVRYLQEVGEEARHARALASVAELLDLPEPPHRMECFDNSNLGGTDPVAAMAVFLDGRPARREYRRYRIKTVVGSDDYASMREVLTRRLRRLRDEDRGLPDLWVIDGGRGQVGIAVEVVRAAGVELPIVGVSKPRTERARGDRAATDKLVLPGRRESLRPPAHDPGLRLLQHLRDETHKHAVGYHRKVRRKNTLVSVLEAIPGVGPARRKALLRGLGSARGVADATVEELADVPGIGPELAERIWATLHRSPAT